MARKPRRAALNRPVFTQATFSSSGLTVLTTLMHHFTDSGNYEVFVHRRGRLVARIPIAVTLECAERQLNVDLAQLEGEENGTGRCRDTSRRNLAPGGLFSLYVSRGTGRYQIIISTIDEKAETKKTVLDNSQCVPAGDLFAVTLVRPGVYHLVESRRDYETEIHVRLPRGANDYRPGQPQLVELREEGRSQQGPIELYSGQTIVLRCMRDASVKIRLVEPDEGAEDPIRQSPVSRPKVDQQRPDHGE